MYMVELMKQLGCTCDAVNNGREAAAAAAQQKYDLVLMDCQMPEMAGLEATRRIRQWEADAALAGHLPVIALTANAIKGDRQRCLDAGMDEYLSKPVQKDQIVNMFNRFLGDAECPPTEATIATNDEAERLPETAPIDAESLLSRCFENLEFAGSLLDELESTGLQRVEEIRRRIAGQDATGTADAAHALKGAAGILCAESVQQLAAQIEQAGRSSDMEDVEALLGELASEMDQCLSYVPQLRKELSAIKGGA
jgi:Amt family ammonium transporter